VNGGRFGRPNEQYVFFFFFSDMQALAPLAAQAAQAAGLQVILQPRVADAAW
jgi:hypothetical protein